MLLECATLNNPASASVRVDRTISIGLSLSSLEMRKGMGSVHGAAVDTHYTPVSSLQREDEDGSDCERLTDGDDEPDGVQSKVESPVVVHARD